MMLFMDGFDHYGTSSSNLSDNVYAQVTSLVQLDTPSFGARTGRRCLKLTAVNGQQIRRVLPGGAVSEAFVGFAFYAPDLPIEDDRVAIAQFRTGSNAYVISVTLGTDGTLDARDGGVNGTILGSTNGPVIGTNSWNHIEVRCVRDSSAGIIEIRVNEVEVLSATGLNLGTGDIAAWAIEGRGASSDVDEFWFDDLLVNDTSGSYNTTWKGDLRVATQFPDADETPDGWARYGRDKFGSGVFSTNEGCLYVADQPEFAIGSGDFTLEGFIRFYDEPVSGPQTIAGQYDTTNNQRSWRLWRDFDANGELKFTISTDGTFGTVTELIDWAGWEPEIGRYYFLSISRESGTLYLHIDGRLQGAGVADSNTYHSSTSPLWIGTQLIGTGPAAFDTVESDFTMDEFRFTVGTARYNAANYAVPSAAFPRDVGGDPDFADVALLFSFNEDPIVDESGNAFDVDVSSTGTPEALDVSADAAGKYAVIDESDPIDTTYIAADFTFATGELTLTANPTDTETVTLGSITYEFVDTLASANDVLIGADADESLDNLAAAINGAAGEGSTYGTGTTANTAAGAENLGGNQLRATAAAQGTAGNSVASTETLADGSWTGATLAGGADIPDGQEFSFSPLPIDTTQVKAMAVIHRSQKSDAASCTVQTSFHVGSSSANGTDRPITTAFSYYTDMFEEDPDTSAGLTVSSVTGGQIQIDRTT
jgi:hypothetical protein